MAEQVKLHTTDLPLTLNREFYNDLVENFTAIERKMNRLSSEMVELSQKYAEMQKQKQIASETQLITDTGVTMPDHISRTTDIS